MVVRDEAQVQLLVHFEKGGDTRVAFDIRSISLNPYNRCRTQPAPPHPPRPTARHHGGGAGYNTALLVAAVADPRSAPLGPRHSRPYVMYGLDMFWYACLLGVAAREAGEVRPKAEGQHPHPTLP